MINLIKKMNMENKTQNLSSSSFSLFCWNIANPSAQRAGKQASWLRQRPENVLVLTEVKRSEGCLFLKRYFQAYGYNVIFPNPEGKEFGVMIVSKHTLIPSSFSDLVDYLQSRVVSTKLNFQGSKIEIIGIYVPSRDSSYEKIEKKKRFLKSLITTLELNPQSSRRIFCGDFNILEPDHIPYYPFFKEWEYDFYRNLMKYQLKDAFRHLNPKAQEYSWVGRTGDGYRYDHYFISTDLLSFVKKCYYLHEPRKIRLSDHSALIAELNL